MTIYGASEDMLTDAYITLQQKIAATYKHKQSPYMAYLQLQERDCHNVDCMCKMT